MNKMFLKLSIILSVYIQCLCSVPWIAEKKDANWMSHHEALLNQTAQHKSDIQLVFLGDSITFGWANYGKTVWNEYYKPRHAYNYGIGGDRTENVIWRIEHDEFDGVKPKAVVLMIGTNNLYNNTVEDIAKGIKEVIHQLEVKLPTAKVLLLAILPRKGGGNNKVKEINKIISGYGDKKTVFYLDMNPHFEMPDGTEQTDLFADGLHPNTKGYTIWHQVMESSLKTVLGEH